jgi:hypothetical protein
MGPADEFYAGVIGLARAVVASRPRPRQRPTPAPDPAGDALLGSCQRCRVGVERIATQAPWRAVVAGVGGDRELCDGEDPGRGNVIRKGHGPVAPDHGPAPEYDAPTECYCGATSHPPCLVCCP